MPDHPMSRWQRFFLGSGWLAFAASLLALATVLSVSYQYRAVGRVVEDAFATQVRAEVDLVAAIVASTPDDLGRSLAGWRLPRERRLTVIEADGRVSYDSQADIRAMDDHAGRPEVIEARATGAGFARRHSATLGREVINAARLMRDGRVVRVGATVEPGRGPIVGLWWPMAAASALVILVAGALVGVQLRRDRTRFGELVEVARAFSVGRLDRRAGLLGRDALARLGHELNDLGARLQASRDELASQRALLDGALGALGEGVACLDRLDRVLYANPAYRQFAAGGADVLGQPYYQHLAEAGIGERLQRLRDGADPRLWSDGVDCDHRRRHLRVSLAPAGPEVVALVVHDLTEVRRLEATRRDFVASVSHELKTPLTAIMGYSETLLDGVIDESPAIARDFVGKIARHAERLATLVRDVLTLSRLEQGAWDVQVDDADLVQVSRAVLDEYQGPASERAVKLVLEAPATLPARTDAELMRQMIGNLVSNAVRYNRPEGTVWLRLAVVDGGRVLITVRDTGIGIPAEHRERVFERFFRVDAHRSRATGGTGLGLAIVKQLAEVLGGAISVESGDHGTAFHIDLPLHAAVA